MCLSPITLVLLLNNNVAIALGLRETLDKLESINGAFACIPLAFLLPVMFHYKLVAETKTEKIIDLAISALNFILMVMCSVLTFIYWSD